MAIETSGCIIHPPDERRDGIGDSPSDGHLSEAVTWIHTMTLLTRVRGVLGAETAVYECRHCGTTLESELDECPTCGKDAVVRYEIQ